MTWFVVARIFLAGFLGREAVHDLATAEWWWACAAGLLALLNLVTALHDVLQERRLAE